MAGEAHHARGVQRAADGRADCAQRRTARGRRARSLLVRTCLSRPGLSATGSVRYEIIRRDISGAARRESSALWRRVVGLQPCDYGRLCSLCALIFSMREITDTRADDLTGRRVEWSGPRAIRAIVPCAYAYSRRDVGNAQTEAAFRCSVGLGERGIY